MAASSPEREGDAHAHAHAHDDDWPCPQACDLLATRRPSWQDQLASTVEVSTPFGTPASPLLCTHTGTATTTAPLSPRLPASPKIQVHQILHPFCSGYTFPAVNAAAPSQPTPTASTTPTTTRPPTTTHHLHSNSASVSHSNNPLPAVLAHAYPALRSPSAVDRVHRALPSPSPLNPAPSDTKCGNLSHQLPALALGTCQHPQPSPSSKQSLQSLPSLLQAYPPNPQQLASFQNAVPQPSPPPTCASPVVIAPHPVAAVTNNATPVTTASIPSAEQADACEALITSSGSQVTFVSPFISAAATGGLKPSNFRPAHDDEPPLSPRNNHSPAPLPLPPHRIESQRASPAAPAAAEESLSSSVKSTSSSLLPPAFLSARSIGSFSGESSTTSSIPTPSSAASHLEPWSSPFEADFNAARPTAPMATPSSPSLVELEFAPQLPSPLPKGLGFSSAHPADLSNGPSSATLVNAQKPKHIRRRSVDVGTLVNARGHQRHGRTAKQDAPAAAFVPPDQLKAERVQRQVLQRSESQFSQHLTTTLAHALFLCSVGAIDNSFEVEGSSSTDSSPRSSISSEASSYGASHTEHSPATAYLRRHRLPSFTSVSPRRRIELIESLASWAFDPNELDHDEVCECACILFECLLCMDGIDQAVTIARIRPFLLSLRAAYHSRNAYHNFFHAVDVTQACYSFLVKLGLAPPLTTLTDPTLSGQWRRRPQIEKAGAIGSVLRPMDVFALLLAAIGHDVGHPGLSNAYMVNARTPAALVYQDKSVLENFHSVTLARMLKMHGLGYLLESEHGATDFRQVLLASVLATDMGRHFPFVGKLNELGTRLQQTDFLSENIRDDRLLICSGLMKCADISNPTRPHKVAKQWSTALLEEWQAQAEIEAKFKLPISVVTLDPSERLAQAKSQVGFIKLFTQPLFDAMTSVVPDFQYFADCCRDGQSVWESVVAGTINDDSTPLPSRPTSMLVTEEITTPKIGANESGVLATPPSQPLRPSLPPPSRGFSSRLSPHRTPRPLNLVDSHLHSRLNPDHSEPASAKSNLSLSTSPGAPSLFDRNSSICSLASNSSWLTPSSVDDCVALGDEECNGDCGPVTEACASCTRKILSEQHQQGGELEPGFLMSGSPIEYGIWPPEPFRPRSAGVGEP